MHEELNKYIYDGPVECFGKCVANRWRGETMAPTAGKARSNLTYQVKKQLRLTAGTKITLPGEIKVIN